VRFQASSRSPVDDFLVTGTAPDGSTNRLSVAVRRAPSFVESDAPSVQLLADYLRVVTTQWEDVSSGRWRLGLSVARRDERLRDLEALATIAHASRDVTAFGDQIATAGQTTARARHRLDYFRAAVERASRQVATHGVGREELAWRLLSALQITELRLEGVDQADRTVAVGRLRALTADGAVATADALFARLVELAGRYGPAGAEVTEALLRRDLAGFALARSASYRSQWAKLDLLAQRLRDRTGFRLKGATGDLEFERAPLRSELRTRIAAAAHSAGVLLVHGEPDVGKSSLVLRVADGLQEAGVEVVAVSLRDLPTRTAELEAELGAPLERVFGAAATGNGRLLIIDGAESVLQGQSLLLHDLATAALRQGFAIVAVSRSDGSKAVQQDLNRACGGVGIDASAAYEVPVLTAAETNEVARTFPSLARLLNDERTSRLLARPGLADMLLRAGELGRLEAEPLSEADVFGRFWTEVVRHGERVDAGGPSPDAREQALVVLARRELNSAAPAERPNASALASLRSDGLLLPVVPATVWNPGDQFAGDLVRDFALARLLIVDGWEPLDLAGAPRWAIRAVRLACQGALIAAGSNRERVRVGLHATFDDLATRHGTRWSELPVEALLTLGSARDALAEAWPAIAAADDTELMTLLRLAEQRYTTAEVGDPLVLAPIVELAFCGDRDLGQHDRHSWRGPGELIRKLVLAWLRGLSGSEAGPTQLRQRVRDVILDRKPEAYDEFAVEAISTLGPDLDKRAEQFLLGLADADGGHLAPAVEEIGPILAMSATKPELLIRLAEAYYIEPPPRAEHGMFEGDWYEFSGGIRSHRGARGIGARLAAWYYGPFFRLLNVRPRETLGLINRMLDRAAIVEVSRDLRRPAADPQPETPGIDLQLLGLGTRLCVGSSRTWSWYRGSTTGPYACVSALAAVERFADRLIATLGIPTAQVCELLLRDCHNLAMPGLVAGVLVRHRALQFLDPWLARPELWEFEFQRIAAEGVLHVQGFDDDSVVGREQRRCSFREVAAEMTLTAVAGKDGDRLTVLARIADELLRNARTILGDDGDADAYLAAIEGWAAALHPENYEVQESDKGHVVFQLQPPPDVAARLEPNQAEIERSGEAIHLLSSYARNRDRSGPLDNLAADIHVGRRLAQHAAPDATFLRGMDPVAAVAATAILASVRGDLAVPRDDLCWAAEVLIGVASNPRIDEFSIPESYFEQGADRSAAVALPAIGLTRLIGVELPLDDYIRALSASARSEFDEVRAALVVGARIVWAAPCQSVGDDCLHRVVWRAVESGLEDCRLGDWDGNGRRQPDPLDGPYQEALASVPADRLYLNRIAHPLIAAWDAHRSGSCVSGAAAGLLAVLLEAHRRVAALWATKGYGGFSDRDREGIARVLTEAGSAGDFGPLAGHLDAFAENGRALYELLSDMARVFTYDLDVAPAFLVVWREVMRVVLAAWEAGRTIAPRDHWADYALASVLPTPTIAVVDHDIDATLARARSNWLAPVDLWEFVQRWVPFARGKPKAVDAAVQLTECADRPWQASAGLALIEDLIGDQYESVASRTWYLVDWLKDIRTEQHMDSPSTARWRRVVDGLASNRDNKAARLQAVEE
jgi:hypothetical protein